MAVERAVAAAVTVQAPADGPETAPQPARILVVDDEAAIVTVAVEALRASGYDAIGVREPPEALALSDQPFDVLVTDFRMPGLDGVELFNRLRETNPWLVGVLATGYGNLRLVQSAMRSGFSAILLKPFRLDRLSDCVRRAIRHRRLAEENHRLGAILDVYAAGQQLGGLRRREELAEKLAELAAGQFGARGAEVLLAGGEQPELTLRCRPERLPALDIVAELQGLAPEAALARLAAGSSHGTTAQPLEFRDRCEGLLLLQLPAPLQAVESERLSLLAHQAAAGMAHIRLFEGRLREEKLALVGRLAGAICERVQAPVGRIRELAESMQVDDEDYRSMILENTARLDVMCGELSDFMTGEESLVRETIDLGRLLHGVARHWEPELRGRGIALELQCEAELEASVDARKISRALQNLIKNAAEAMPDGGPLHLRLERGVGVAVIEVADRGIGMSPEVVTHLFDPFFTHGKIGGTGLGGAVVRSAIHAHGGRVEVHSEPGRGSTFRLHLPLQAAGAAAP